MGNIISIKNSNGANITSSTHIANLNPIRYKGYYYDSETGFYYLNSRYYDPEIGRFINADDISVISLDPTSLYDKNLYSYCDNNPVSRYDDTGNIWYVAGLLNVSITLFSSFVTGEKVSIFDLGVDFALGALGTFDLPYKIDAAIITGAIESKKVYDDTKSETLALAQGLFSGTLSIITIGDKLGNYFDDSDKIAKCFVSSIFDTGQSLVVFGIDQINYSFRDRKCKVYNSKRRKVVNEKHRFRR